MNPRLPQSILAFMLQPIPFPALPPISGSGTVDEIIGTLGGADGLRTAINQLQSPWCAA